MSENGSSVSSEDIVAAYRMFLGRKPSVEEVSVWQGIRSLGERRAAFLESAEFSANQPKAAPEKLPRNLPGTDVEWQTDAATTSLLLKHVKQTWTALGESRPHWSVLSGDDFLPEQIAQNEKAFFDSGKHTLAALTSALKRHGVSSNLNVYEFGCGIGRVTAYLAATFPQVTACDISQSHLDRARQELADRKNVKFKLVEDDRFAMTEPFDLWTSFIVLQHNPPPIIAMILARMFMKLARGGLAMFQVPTYCLGYRFKVAEYLGGGALDGAIEMHCLPQSVIFNLAHQAGCVALEVRENDDMGPPSQWLSNTFIFRKPPIPKP